MVLGGAGWGGGVIDALMLMGEVWVGCLSFRCGWAG